MTESVVTAPRGSTVRHVAELMRERNVGSVVLVEEDRPVGFVTDRDLTVSVLADGRDAEDRAVDHGSAPVVTADPGDSLGEAAELMIRHAVRRLVVVEEDRLIGIVTLDDIAARTGDAELGQALSSRVTRAVLPTFFFQGRGEG
jgi:CBS domain-containing protein